MMDSGSPMKMSLLLLVYFILSISTLKHSRGEKVPPAMYVFGDSLVDVGNNNYIPLSVFKADFPFNGIDYPSNLPTGRFSNGKNAADLIAENLKLPSPPPYLSLLWKKNDKSFFTGVSFASGGGGILNGTGQSDLGCAISFTQQVDDYMSVYEDLVKKLGQSQAEKHLSKSLFVIVTGSNDILSYDRSSDLQKKNTPQQYVKTMILTVKRQIQRLQSYGARKFLFAGLPILGCLPSQRIASKSLGCNEDINSLSLKFNEGIKPVLHELKSELKDMNYLYYDTYSVSQNILRKPTAYGFTEIKAACCGLGKLKAEIPCTPISTYCSNRNNHVFWDPVHPTEAADRILVNTIFNGPFQYSSPINVKQLLAT